MKDTDENLLAEAIDQLFIQTTINTAEIEYIGNMLMGTYVTSLPPKIAKQYVTDYFDSLIKLQRQAVASLEAVVLAESTKELLAANKLDNVVRLEERKLQYLENIDNWAERLKDE